jgi:16S rRNA (guanine(1405)-N(7))-methyltransferase
VDVVFLFKVLPCLEQQEKGAGLRVLSSLSARYAIASFPTRSLGGFNKGMSENYGRYARSLAEELRAKVQEMEFASETFYIYKFG